MFNLVSSMIFGFIVGFFFTGSLSNDIAALVILFSIIFSGILLTLLEISVFLRKLCKP